jgi:two-component system chemotaxis response regulator CheB
MSSNRELIVIGTSTGGLGALRQIFAGLPANFPAAVLAVMHIGSNYSILPELLSPHSALPVRYARDGDKIGPGVILLAPPDHHLLVEAENIRLSHGPKENFSRPAIDPLFRSAALNYKGKVIGVVLTGDLDDGTIGLQAIKAYGGTAVVQEPSDSIAPSMPLSAMEYVEIDHCVPLNTIAALLIDLVAQPVDTRPYHVTCDEHFSVENQLALHGESTMEEVEKIGTPSPFTCPECHGTLWEVEGAQPQRFRCHTGHAFTSRSLIATQNQSTEESIWGAIRALHEKAALHRRFAKSARETNRLEAAAEYAAAAEQAAHQADILRKIVTNL